MKPLVAIALAIAHCRPSLPKAEVDAYAAIVDKRSAAIGVDPILIVGLVDHESGWLHGAVNKKSGALGFGQILPQFRSACAQPSSAACSAEKSKLLGGVYNLGAVFDAVEAWQRECKKKTGSMSEGAWLSAYAGLNDLKARKWCGRQLKDGKWSWLPTHAIVEQVFKHRKDLRLLLP